MKDFIKHNVYWIMASVVLLVADIFFATLVIPTHNTKIETESTESDEDSAIDWMSLYIEYMNDSLQVMSNNYFTDYGRWSMFYLDDDDIPEILIVSGWGGFGIMSDFLSIQEGRVVRYELDYIREYLERRGVFLSSWADGGDYEYKISSFENGKIIPLHDYTEYIDHNYPCEPGDFSDHYIYSLDNETVEQSEGQRLLKQYFNDLGNTKSLYERSCDNLKSRIRAYYKEKQMTR